MGMEEREGEGQNGGREGGKEKGLVRGKGGQKEIWYMCITAAAVFTAD